MQQDVCNKSAIVMLRFFTLSVWTTFLMETFGGDFLKWQLSNSFLFTISTGFQYAGDRAWAWIGLVNIVLFILAFLSAGALLSALTFMVFQHVRQSLRSLIRSVSSHRQTGNFTRL